MALAASMLAVGLLWPRAIGAGAQQPTPAVSPAAVGDPFVGSATLQRSIASLQVRLHNNPRDWQSLAVLGLDYLQEARATVDPSY